MGHLQPASPALVAPLCHSVTSHILETGDYRTSYALQYIHHDQLPPAPVCNFVFPTVIIHSSASGRFNYQLTASTPHCLSVIPSIRPHSGQLQVHPLSVQWHVSARQGLVPYR
ncbi:hypothetical protein CC79DRAFT_78781 [Sarocladium strictum]